jgi:hypothetical protein
MTSSVGQGTALEASASIRPRFRPRGERRLAPARCNLFFCALADLFGLILLTVQLRPPGAPHPAEGFAEQLRATFSSKIYTATYSDTLLILAACAVVFPTLFGALGGAILVLRWAAWVYAASLVLMVAFRLFLLFEISGHVASPTRLVLDMISSSLCIVVQLFAIDAAAQLALITSYLEAKFDWKTELNARLAVRGRPAADGSHGTGNGSSSRGGSAVVDPEVSHAVVVP